MKILYVCPQAHYPGHYSYSARNEVSCLSESDIEVSLLTFEGLLGDEPFSVRTEYTVLSKRWPFLGLLRSWLPTKWLLMYWEDFFTIRKALQLRKALAVDIIYLVHGDAFIFIPHIFGFFTKGVCWVIWQISYPAHYPRNILRRAVFYIMDAVVHAPWWRPVYRISLSRNRFAYVATHVSDYQAYQNGIFADRLFPVPLAHYGSIGEFIPKEQARGLLHLPEDTLILLSFGTVHAGKDLATVFKAVENLDHVVLVQAGKIPTGWDLGANKPENVIICNQYISEDKKRLYFYAADAVVLSYMENFQNASMLWEACRFKKPVIVSDCGDLGDPVRKFNVGLLFAPQQADSLRQAINSFACLLPEKKEEMAKNCELFNQEYSPVRWTKAMVNVCNYLLHQ